MLRAMIASGMSQAQIARELGVTEFAIDQQLQRVPELGGVHPAVVVAAAAPVLRALADDHGYSQLAVFGSVARGEARQDSDIDLLVQPPDGESSFGFVRFKLLVEQVLGRTVDLAPYGGLTPGIDEDVRRDMTLL